MEKFQFFNVLFGNIVPFITAGGPWLLETYFYPSGSVSLPLTLTNKNYWLRQHWNFRKIHLHHHKVKIYIYKKIMIRNKCKKSTLPSSHSHGLKTFVVHTFIFFWHKSFFWHFFPQFLLRRLNSTVILFRAARSSRFCANIQCISIQ